MSDLTEIRRLIALLRALGVKRQEYDLASPYRQAGPHWCFGPGRCWACDRAWKEPTR